MSTATDSNAGSRPSVTDGLIFDVTNPADGAIIGRVADQSAADARTAIARAAAAFRPWSKRPAKDRAVILRKWFDLLMANQDALARLMTSEQGKPLAEARGEVAYGASFVEWFAEEGKRLYGDVIPSPASGNKLIVVPQAIGVVAAITPWNFPIAMITRKVAPALAAGCTVVVKPAAETPLCALAVRDLAIEAGVPEDAFSIITTTDAVAVGLELTTNPLVRRVAFTGSTEVGKTLMRQSASTVKRLSLELGGNAPFIVFDDADIDAAVAGAILSKYRNAGQTCVCSNRFLVQASVYDDFVRKFAAAVASLKVAEGTVKGAQIGPLINDAAMAKVQRLVADAVGLGATVVTGGQIDAAGPRFYAPTILAGVTQDMEILDAEIFGPVAPVLRFETEDDAIRIANDTPSGLAAYFYARDIGRIWRVADALEVGMIGINEGAISNEMAPFGGVKQSGIGREGSKFGIDEYVERKYLCMGGL